MHVLKSASKLCLLFAVITSGIGFLIGIIPSHDFLNFVVTPIVIFYFGKKSDDMDEKPKE